MKKYLFGRFHINPMMEADGGGAGGSGGDGGTGGSGGAGGSGTGGTEMQFDYERLAEIVAGKQQVAEDTVLKNYFKQQGLSQEEAQQAIAKFKAEKEKNKPDINALQKNAQQAQAKAQQAVLEKDATLEAIKMGIDAKMIPYVLKLADMTGVVGEDGKVNQENLQKALKKVLEDVPALKANNNSAGGFQFGSGGGNGGTEGADEKALKAAFGL